MLAFGIYARASDLLACPARRLGATRHGGSCHCFTFGESCLCPLLVSNLKDWAAGWLIVLGTRVASIGTTACCGTLSVHASRGLLFGGCSLVDLDSMFFCKKMFCLLPSRPRRTWLAPIILSGTAGHLMVGHMARHQWQKFRKRRQWQTCSSVARYEKALMWLRSPQTSPDISLLASQSAARDVPHNAMQSVLTLGWIPMFNV